VQLRRRLLVVLRRRVLLVSIIVLAGLGAAYLGTSRAAVYESDTSLFVGQGATNLQPATQVAQAVLAQTFVLIVPTQAVIGDAIAAAHVPRQAAEVVRATKASAPAGTNLIKITVRDPDPVVAQTLANSIAVVFIADARSLAPLTAAATGLSPDKAPASIAQKASLPAAPLASGLGRNVALGGLTSLLVGIAVVLLLDFLGLSARTPRQLESQMELPVIGIVPLQPRVASAAGGTGADLPLLVVRDA